MQFAPSQPDDRRLAYNEKEVVERLEQLRRALPPEPINPIPDNLFDLEKISRGLHSATNQYLNCYPDRSGMSKADYYTASVNSLIRADDLEYVISTSKILDLQGLFDLLHSFNEEKTEIAFVGLEESLGEAFNENACKTDEEREALLLRTLKRLGYPDAVVQLRPAFEQSAPKASTAGTAPDLPAAAPELWADRTTGRAENPVSFIKRVYAPWIGQGFTRAHLRDLDPLLYNALATWSRRHPEDKLDLPSRPHVHRSQEMVLGEGPLMPTDRMSPEERERLRAYKALKMREYRSRSG